MKKISINHITDIVSIPISIGSGDTAVCYRCKDGNVFKKFKNNDNAEEVMEKEYFFDILEALCESSNNSFIGPKKLVYQKDRFVGYIYEYVEGRTLKYMSPRTKVSTLLEPVDTLFEDLKRITSVGIELHDVHTKNILFDGKHHVIDMDKSFFSKDSGETLELKNKRLLVTTIFNKIYGLSREEVGEFMNVDVEYFEYNDDASWELFKELMKEYQRICKCDNPSLFQVRNKTLSYKRDNDYEISRNSMYY